MTTFGAQQSGVAWSTSKVPLAIAALARPTSGTEASVRRAIRASDNQAAEQLWQQLGGGTGAAAAVDRVLRAGGDQRTRTVAESVRPPWSPYGQTQWRLDDQAVFASHLPCMPGATSVVQHMRQVDGGQQWGLARVKGAAVKGGWGPTSGSGYLVRQMVVLPADGGHLGVALMVDSPAGFDAGVADLDRMARWVQENQTALPSGGGC
ncbi:hypothetical protein ACTQ49_10020 [Luteococcus sp. Sow4_B9]|uniref:hypothetical protein n=1 Tax=Luteococcus sp. Sow4_B9 TaxID=3438792 RepID=UPI003F9DA7A7